MVPGVCVLDGRLVVPIVLPVVVSVVGKCVAGTVDALPSEMKLWPLILLQREIKL